MVEWYRGAFVVMCAIGAAAGTAAEGFQTGFLALVDNMIKRADNLELIDGVTFVKTSEATPKSLGGDFGMLLLDRFNTFVNTHSLRMNLAESDFEGRGKRKGNKKMKGGKKYLLPIILGIKAKMALLSGLIGHTIAIIAAKAILVSKIALILGMLLFLKKLVSNPPKTIEHAHIKHRKILLPTEDEVHRRDSRWESERSDEEADDTPAQEMAYRRQRPMH